MKLTKKKLEQLITEEMLKKKLNENQDHIDKLVNMINSSDPETIRQGLLFAEAIDYIYNFQETDLFPEEWMPKTTRVVEFEAAPEFAVALFNSVKSDNLRIPGKTIYNFDIKPKPPTEASAHQIYFNFEDPDFEERM
jgi:hypothetical protein